MSRISFERNGLVGVDIKSHQTKTTIPYPAITKGNDTQDINCEDIRRLPTMDNIKYQAEDHSLTSAEKAVWSPAQRPNL